MLGVRPDKRHRRAGGSADEEFPLGNVRCIPHLLGNEVAVAGETFEGGEQRFRPNAIPGCQLVMRALAGKQRPRTSDAGAVELLAVLVLAIAIAVIAPPAGSRRQIGP